MKKIAEKQSVVTKIQKCKNREFPGSPKVTCLSCQCRGMISIIGLRTKISA